MVYGSVYANGRSLLEDVEPVLYDEELSFMEMGALALEEATNDWNQFMRAVALTELSYVIESGGQEMIYEAVDIKAMADKVIAWFKKLWAKIKGIAETALAKFMTWGKDDQKFIDKFGDKIYDGARNIPGGFSFKGWKFDSSAMDPNSGVPAIIKRVSKQFVDSEMAFKTISNHAFNASKGDVASKNEKNYAEKLDQYRSELAGGAFVKGASDFNKAFHKYLYGSDAKQYINKGDVDAKSLIDCISGAKEAKEGASSVRDEVKQSIDDSIAKVDEAKSAVNDRETAPEATEMREYNSKLATALTNMSSYLKGIQNVNTTAFSTYISALRDRNRQSKAICVKLVSYSHKETKLGESFSGYNGGSILSSRFADVIM